MTATQQFVGGWGGGRFSDLFYLIIIIIIIIKIIIIIITTLFKVDNIILQVTSIFNMVHCNIIKIDK